MRLRRLRESDLEQAWELDREAFNVPEKRREHFLRLAVADQFVGAFDGERLLAQSRALSLGQFFGGRSVPMGGLSSVATAPHARGRGLAKRIIKDCLEIMRERGDAISTLHPATTELYRQVGWEVAGACVFRTLAPRVLVGLSEPHGVRTRRGSADDLDAIRACYRRLAPQVNGFVDRPDRVWEAYAAGWKESRVFVAEDESQDAVGYLVYRHMPGRFGSMGGPFGLFVEDHVAITRDAGLALWRLVGSWASQVENVFYRGPAEDPLLLLLPQQELKVTAELRWMTRMVDAVRAIETRGFAPGLEVDVQLALRDPILAANDGRFVLTVSKGRGRLEPGGGGSIELDVGSFASLYTGWANAATLARTGRLTGGSDEERAALDAGFAGPTPWMLEEF